jgi:hypothetical protein
MDLSIKQEPTGERSLSKNLLVVGIERLSENNNGKGP